MVCELYVEETIVLFIFLSVHDGISLDKIKIARPKKIKNHEESNRFMAVIVVVNLKLQLNQICAEKKFIHFLFFFLLLTGETLLF